MTHSTLTNSKCQFTRDESDLKTFVSVLSQQRTEFIVVEISITDETSTKMIRYFHTIFKYYHAKEDNLIQTFRVIRKSHE